MRLITRIACLALALVSFTASAQRTTRAVAPSFPDFSRILVIAAHPDDELLVAAFLGNRCVEGSSRCSLLLMTHGESGACALPVGCGTNLGATRAAEAAQSADLLGTQLEIWGLADVMTDVAGQWAASSGGHAALIARLKNAINEHKPTMIVTFDPVHGSTCHPAHRTVAALTVEAADGGPVYFIETRVKFDGPSIRLSRALAFGKSIVLLDETKNWHFVSDAARLHASQFDVAQLTSLDEPSQFRSLLLLPAAHSEGARYEGGCP